MTFSAAFRQSWRQSNGSWRTEIPIGWAQGRAVFGGVLAAAAVSLARRNCETHWLVRSFSLRFFRPASSGELLGDYRVERQGKGTTFAEVVLSQGTQAVAAVSLVMVKHREGALVIKPPTAPQMKPVDELAEMPYLEGLTPEFTQHFAFRWAEGGLPFSNAEKASFSGYCKFREPAGDVEAVVGLLDAWPCPSLSVLEKTTMASSVSWTAHIASIPKSFDSWFSFHYETVFGSGGFHTTVGRLYSPSGALVGWTEQLAAVFA